jgi:hypothetical protein
MVNNVQDDMADGVTIQKTSRLHYKAQMVKAV